MTCQSIASNVYTSKEKGIGERRIGEGYIVYFIGYIEESEMVYREGNKYKQGPPRRGGEKLHIPHAAIITVDV